jgi:hypothetical protein
MVLDFVGDVEDDITILSLPSGWIGLCQSKRAWSDLVFRSRAAVDPEIA